MLTILGSIRFKDKISYAVYPCVAINGAIKIAPIPVNPISFFAINIPKIHFNLSSRPAIKEPMDEKNHSFRARHPLLQRC